MCKSCEVAGPRKEFWAIRGVSYYFISVGHAVEDGIVPIMSHCFITTSWPRNVSRPILAGEAADPHLCDAKAKPKPSHHEIHFQGQRSGKTRLSVCLSMAAWRYGCLTLQVTLPSTANEPNYKLTFTTPSWRENMFQLEYIYLGNGQKGFSLSSNAYDCTLIHCAKLRKQRCNDKNVLSEGKSKRFEVNNHKMVSTFLEGWVTPGESVFDDWFRGTNVSWNAETA